MKPILRIYFTDFWPDFDINNNYFKNILETKYDVIIDQENPDILIFSCYSNDFLKYENTIRIFYTAENIRPSFWECQYSISFDYNLYGNRNIRLPLYVLYDRNYDLLQPKNSDDILAKKNKFCNFIVSNSMCKIRNEFFKILNNKKQVDSGGRFLNNIGTEVSNKMDFIKDYRFTIAFENTSFPGYTTEKIFEPMAVNSIPIYWGNKLIDREFNSQSFINVHDFSTLNECANYVLELEENEQLLKSVLNQPWFPNNQLPEYFNTNRILEFFDQILNSTKPKKLNRNKANLSFQFRNNRFIKILKYKTIDELKYIKTVKINPILNTL